MLLDGWVVPVFKMRNISKGHIWSGGYITLTLDTTLWRFQSRERKRHQQISIIIMLSTIKEKYKMFKKKNRQTKYNLGE